LWRVSGLRQQRRIKQKGAVIHAKGQQQMMRRHDADKSDVTCHGIFPPLSTRVWPNFDLTPWFSTV
jgi:hypothetical protein